MNMEHMILPVLLYLVVSSGLKSQTSRTSLVLTQKDIVSMKDGLKKYPLFTKSFNETQAIVENALLHPIDVPVPKDAAGYTHERHKKNYREMQMAGVLYQVTGEKRYAIFVRDMLLQYAKLYPTLKRHPEALGNDGGRLFWQTLNETVWLVNTAQAYDCIYTWLKPQERATIEQNVFRQIAKFFIEEQISTLDRIHNHGTWMVASIGMLGYVLHDQNLVDIALYGTKKDHSAGFLKQLELLFSPDGYYTEGAYYARYAILPFFVFAQAIEHNQPELKIFDYRNQILKKALLAVFQQSYSNGALIPINDALKEKNFRSEELVFALDLTYQMYGKEKNLLSLVWQQNAVSLNGAGLAVARDLAENQNVPDFSYRSVEFSDGANGDEGGLGLLRSGTLTDQSFLVMKYTAQGMGHGHFDKLNYLYYDKGREIIQDYGSARFVNVDPKFGGRYLSENTSWAKQTVAHNTVVVDEQSHFKGVYEIAKLKHADRHFFNVSNPDFQVMSAKCSTAYDGIAFQRTMALVRDKKLSKPVVIDVFRIAADKEHQYDLPFYYLGQFISTNVNYTPFTKARTILGSEHGYQHLWKVAEGTANTELRFTWLNGGRFYSLISAADSTTQVFFTQIGASDPDFNLRNESGIMLRLRAKDHVFASVIEPHGLFDPENEISAGAKSTIQSVQVVASTDEGTIVQISGSSSLNWIMMIANGVASETQQHSMIVDGTTYQWIGNASLQKQ
jgi:oligo-alginate lyase